FRVGDIVPVASEVVIESISDGVVVLDEQDRIVDLNPAGQRMLDYTASGAIGRLVERIWPDWPDLIGSYGDWAGTSEEVVLGKGGARRVYDVRLSPISDWRGRLTSRVVVLRDITERKRAEEALRQRTAELQARNEELDAFAHTVAHDLQNPLGLVIGFAETLEQDHATMPDEELSRYLHTIARSVRRVSSIVDELLLLSEVPKMEVQARPLDMARIVAEAQQRLTHMIEEYQAEIILPETWPVALGYGPWVEGVWVNYLNNAIKYGGQPPRVELGATVQADGMVRFWVRDNGPGLTPEGQALLFTPFTRLDQVRTKGHGLGLSIARRIVEKLDGQVGVESEVGRGSTFSFTLPGVVT
ncbi:MAG: PAS domain S-box protein, partial [Anaerolineae bacterium]|nr:PAS domain S-box protein [Anaerolineae bacterium]